MDEATRKLLEANDDPIGCEVPANDWSSFGYKDLQLSVSHLQASLATELSLHFERDGSVLDASFHDQLWIVDPTPRRIHAS
jgi:hypothetical protein